MTNYKTKHTHKDNTTGATVTIFNERNKYKRIYLQ